MSHILFATFLSFDWWQIKYMYINICMFSVTCVRSIFEGGAIPYPKRDFLAEDDPDDKADVVGAKRPNYDTVSTAY